MPLIWFTVGFFSGILSADFFPGKLIWWWLPLLLMLGGWGGFLAARSDREKRPSTSLPAWLLLWLAAGCTLGAVRYRGALPDLTDPGRVSFHADGGPVVLTGLVVDDPQHRDQYTTLRVRVERMRRPGEVRHRAVEGEVLARVEPREHSRYGDRVVLRGNLEIPPEQGNFSYRSYLARQGIHAYLPRARMGLLESGCGGGIKTQIFLLRERALKVIYRLWPDPEASLLAGILLGVESGIPEPVERAFQDTGTSHIIAISGFNITIVAGLFSKVLGRMLRPRWSALTAGVGIALYTILVGADPAVVRAAIMGGLTLLARQLGRRQHGLHALALASLLMAVHDPHIPWMVSFQLSLAATLGLILFGEPLTSWFEGTASRVLRKSTVKKLTQPVSEYVLLTLAAQLTTLPILLTHFQRFSLSSLLVNPLILPLQPGVMILGGLSVILALIWMPLGWATAPLAFVLIYLTIRIVEWFGTFPGAVKAVQVSGWTFSILWYGGLALISGGGQTGWIRKGIAKPSAVFGGLILALVLFWRSLTCAPDGFLHLVFLDVGSGSAILIQSPAGARIMVNGGPAASRLAGELGRVLPPFKRGIDLYLISSPRQEDVRGLEGILDRYPPDGALWLGGPSISRDADFLRSRLLDREVPLTSGERGSSITLDEEVQIRVISETERGGALLVEYGGFRAFLPFGLGKDQLTEDYARRLGRFSLVLLADQGRLESNPPDWFPYLAPRLCVLSVAADDEHGLPDQALLDELGGYSVLRTDRNGTIRVKTDGERMWVEVDHP